MNPISPDAALNQAHDEPARLSAKLYVDAIMVLYSKDLEPFQIGVWLNERGVQIMPDKIEALICSEVRKKALEGKIFRGPLNGG